MLSAGKTQAHRAACRPLRGARAQLGGWRAEGPNGPRRWPPEARAAAVWGAPAPARPRRGKASKARRRPAVAGNCDTERGPPPRPPPPPITVIASWVSLNAIENRKRKTCCGPPRAVCVCAFLFLWTTVVAEEGPPWSSPCRVCAGGRAARPAADKGTPRERERMYVRPLVFARRPRRCGLWTPLATGSLR